MNPHEDGDGDYEEEELSEEQKVSVAKWFLLNSPPGEIQYVAKGSTFLLPFFHTVFLSLLKLYIS